jgi:hypothetical protein
MDSPTHLKGKFTLNVKAQASPGFLKFHSTKLITISDEILFWFIVSPPECLTSVRVCCGPRCGLLSCRL